MDDALTLTESLHSPQQHSSPYAHLRSPSHGPPGLGSSAGQTAGATNKRGHGGLCDATDATDASIQCAEVAKNGRVGEGEGGVKRQAGEGNAPVQSTNSPPTDHSALQPAEGNGTHVGYDPREAAGYRGSAAGNTRAEE